jgi:hypothetical protein
LYFENSDVINTDSKLLAVTPNGSSPKSKYPNPRSKKSLDKIVQAVLTLF